MTATFAPFRQRVGLAVSAKVLLTTGLSLEQVPAEAAFADASHYPVQRWL